MNQPFDWTHITDVKSIAASLQWSDHHPAHSRSQRQPRRHVFCRWCRVREGCQLGWHLLLRVDRDGRSSTPWPFCGSWKRLGFALTRHVTDCGSIAASFSLLSSLAYAFDCSATCGFVCAVDGADYALTDRDLSAGGTCSFGMTAIDVPVLRVGSSTARLLVLTKMKEPTTRSARKKKVNVDLRCRDTGAELPRS